MLIHQLYETLIIHLLVKFSSPWSHEYKSVLVGEHYKLEGPYFEYAYEILLKKSLYEILFYLFAIEYDH
jgi:hypothetical protein